MQIEYLVDSAWTSASAPSTEDSRGKCEAVIERLTDAITEFVSDLVTHLEREEECVVSDAM